MGVVESSVLQEATDQGRRPLRVLHQDPVQVGDVQQRVGQTCQLGFLHGSAVGGGDDVDGGQDVGPRWRPAVDVLGSNHLHDVPVLTRAGLLEGESVSGAGATITPVI